MVVGGQREEEMKEKEREMSRGRRKREGGVSCMGGDSFLQGKGGVGGVRLHCAN